MSSPDYHKLDPEMRAVALVGSFLQCWAQMEDTINDAIGRALGLGVIQKKILTSNLQFRDKIYVLKTIVSITDFRPTTNRVRFDRALNKANKLYVTRNMMAHQRFDASKKGDGVDFLFWKAKGKLSAPNETWDVDRFIGAFVRLGVLSSVFQEMVGGLEELAETEKFLKALRDAPPQTAPIETRGALGLLGFPFHPAPAHPRSSSQRLATAAKRLRKPRKLPPEHLK